MICRYPAYPCTDTGNRFPQYLPAKTIVLKVKDSIDEEQQALAKKVARANGTTVEETFSIEGTDDFSSLKLKQELSSLSKAEGQQKQTLSYILCGWAGCLSDSHRAK